MLLGRDSARTSRASASASRCATTVTGKSRPVATFGTRDRASELVSRSSPGSPTKISSAAVVRCVTADIRRASAPSCIVYPP